MSKPIFDGSVTLRGSPLSFVPKLLKPIKDKHIMSPFELKMKKMFEALKKGKKKKTKKKGGGKSKYNIKMARKFRRTRRKRGSGPGAGSGSGEEEWKESKRQECNKIKEDLSPGNPKELTIEKQEELKPTFEWCKNFMNKNNYSYVDGGRKRSRRKRRRRTKKRKSRRKKKRSRRRRRKKR